jgi:hypothetical protein
LLAHGRWFSPGTPTFSTTKTVRHDIAEILLKVALKHEKFKSNLTNSNVGDYVDRIYHKVEVKSHVVEYNIKGMVVYFLLFFSSDYGYYLYPREINISLNNKYVI